MARTLLTTQTTDITTGLVITAGAGTAGTADGHEFKFGRNVAIIVENGGGGGSVAAPVARKIMDAYLLRENR